MTNEKEKWTLANKSLLERSEISWNEFMDLQNQYRGMAAGNYNNRTKNMKQLSNEWLKQQMMDKQRIKQINQKYGKYQIIRFRKINF